MFRYLAGRYDRKNIRRSLTRQKRIEHRAISFRFDDSFAFRTIPEAEKFFEPLGPAALWPQCIFGTRICGSGYWRRSMTPSSCHIHSKLYVAIGSAGFGCREDWFSRYLSHSATFCRLAADFAA